MLFNLLSALDKKLQFKTVSAHCDIPCKIYDPISAQIAVLTMIRMVDLIEEIQSKDELSLADQAQLGRLVAQKEEHGFKVKEEVRVIWGDYFKQPQFDQFPQTHKLAHDIMLAASKAKQNVNKEQTLALLDLVNEFADIFWQSKQVDTFKAVCPYPPAQQLVYPKLG